MNESSEREPTIDPNVFFSVDLRVGTIIEALEFPEARKPSYKLKIDFGPLGTLQSSAQLTDRYTPDALQGTQVIAVVNLGARRIAGYKSECLVLGLNDSQGGVIRLMPERHVPDGNRVY
ncbi:MAG: tRNA-binding protein [Spirochaetia bacterium]